MVLGLTTIIYDVTYAIGLVAFCLGILTYLKIKKSPLGKVALYTSISVLTSSIHHFIEIFVEEFPFGELLSESIEFVSALLLVVAVYYIFKVSREVFVR